MFVCVFSIPITLKRPRVEIFYMALKWKVCFNFTTKSVNGKSSSVYVCTCEYDNAETQPLRVRNLVYPNYQNRMSVPSIRTNPSFRSVSVCLYLCCFSALLQPQYICLPRTLRPLDHRGKVFGSPFDHRGKVFGSPLDHRGKIFGSPLDPKIQNARAQCDPFLLWKP